jgi:hypothetical protein
MRIGLIAMSGVRVKEGIAPNALGAQNWRPWPRLRPNTVVEAATRPCWLKNVAAMKKRQLQRR